MFVYGVPTGYLLKLSAPERDQMLVALELARACYRGDTEAGVLMADVDADVLDGLADQLFLADKPLIAV